MQREHRLQSLRDRHTAPEHDPNEPAEEQARRIQTPGVQREHDGREDLQDPHAAEQLQIDRVLRRQKHDEQQRTDFTMSDTSFAVLASFSGVMSRAISGHRLRVNRFAAPIDMIAAGTSALIAMGAAAKPTNHDGNSWPNNAGTTSDAECTLMPEALAM